MIRTIVTALFVCLVLSFSAHAEESVGQCTPKPNDLIANGMTVTIDWVDLENVGLTLQCWKTDYVRDHGIVEGVCAGLWVQCTYEDGARVCSYRALRQLVHPAEERVAEESSGNCLVLPEAKPEVTIKREERKVERKAKKTRRTVERGVKKTPPRGRLVAISHRSTMNCWGRGSIPTDQKVSGWCNGAYTVCFGGSLSSGKHRRCYVRR